MNAFTRLLAALLLLAVPLVQASAALAQSDGSLVIGKPDTSAFPTLQFAMDAHDGQGNFIEDLSTDDLWLVENDQRIRPARVEAVQNGLQVIIALNTSPWMATQIDGQNGYQKVQQTLSGWLAAQPQDTPDDFSLSTPTGLHLIRERSPERALAAVNEYQPDLLTTQASLGSLAEALDLATDTLGRPMMKRAVLYITPALPPTPPETIEDVVSRARSTGARVHVWMIAQAGAQTVADNPLRALSDATGGQFVEISLAQGAAPLPEIEPLLAPLRYSYQVSYTSTAQSGGSQRLYVELDSASQVLDSNEVSFDLNVQPPNPIFVSPPAVVELAVDPENPDVLAPETVPLEIIVEFPDGFDRPLAATRLYVDGQVVAENTSAPFERFEWPLGEMSESGSHLLRVEAVDSLGLTGLSIDTPVEVVVEQPEAAGGIAARISTRGLIAIGAIAVAGIALALVLGFTGSRRRLLRGRSAQERRKDKDPVTQPVKIRQEPSRARKDKSTPARPAHSWPAWKRADTPAPARLIALNENEEPLTGGALPLARQEITFGTDPKRATQVLESPTVDGLHARLYRSEDGQYILCDQNSTAGTWINYAPVASAGARLEHGDLIHIGKVMFRFERTEPGRIPVVEVERLDQQS